MEELGLFHKDSTPPMLKMCYLQWRKPTLPIWSTHFKWMSDSRFLGSYVKWHVIYMIWVGDQLQYSRPEPEPNLISISFKNPALSPSLDLRKSSLNSNFMLAMHSGLGLAEPKLHPYLKSSICVSRLYLGPGPGPLFRYASGFRSLI